jgi:hypothetical protein
MLIVLNALHSPEAFSKVGVYCPLPDYSASQTIMVKSKPALVFGASILVASIVLPLALARFAPYLYNGCSIVADNGLVCTGSFGFEFWLTVPLFLAGSRLIAFGISGRRFVGGILFIVGMIPFSLGALLAILQYVSIESCAFFPLPSACIATRSDTIIEALLTIAGLLVMSLQMTLVRNDTPQSLGMDSSR